MLDADLAALYGVVTGNLNLAVRRNEARFPEDFMFQLSRSEADNFDIANCKIKFARWSSNSAICLHPTGRRHALVCAQHSKRRPKLFA
jgi:hypothetical protein